MKSKFRIAAAVFATTTAVWELTACSPSFQARVVPAYDSSICSFQPDDGERATMAKLREDRPSDSGYFGKSYNRPDLEAVLSASARETARYVQAMGVSLYAAPSPRITSCPMFVSLPSPSGRARDVWEASSAGAHDGGELVGLYFEDIDGLPNRTMRRPTIVVSSAADRWTLVHEQLHHAFNRERKRDALSPTTAELAGEVERAAANASSAAAGAASAAGLERYASALDQAARTFNELLERTLFEEIAVEGVLLEEWSSGRLRFVSGQAAINAAAYAAMAREAGLASLDDVGKRSTQAKVQADARGWTEAAETAGRTLRFLAGVQETTAQMALRLRALAIPGSSVRPRQTWAAPAKIPALRQTPRHCAGGSDGDRDLRRASQALAELPDLPSAAD